MKISFFFLFLILLMFVSSSDSLQQQPPQPPPLHLKIKDLLNRAQSYFFPPNLDFRGRSLRNEEASASEIEGGAGEKVKEAVTKSLGKGKATVEETAKSAAEKLKDTFSSHHDAAQQEL